MKYLFNIAAVIFAALTSLSVRAPSNQTADEKAIRQAIELMAAAFNGRNEDVAKSLMTEDADFVNVRGTWSKGAAKIAQSRHARFQTALKNASIRVLDVQIRFIRPDVALIHELHEIVGMLDENGKELPPHRSSAFACS
jgi:uncharacterized protein (TIGR02246 family)